MPLKLNVAKLNQQIRGFNDFLTAGPLVSVQGSVLARLSAAIGDLCLIRTADGNSTLAEVIGFSGDRCQLMPLEKNDCLEPGSLVVSLNRRLTVPVGRKILGRVIDALGNPIDGGGPLAPASWRQLTFEPPAALSRPPINQQLITGQKAIDGLLPLGVGQRVGLFAGSGVGKSTLLGEIAKRATSDINIVALIGERGREVRPFVEDCLGAEGLARSIVIVSTVDQAPLLRLRAAQTAVTIADWFRRQGAQVMLMLDSLSRLAVAQRELAILLGEPPTSRGFPPSVFQYMSNLVEQLGNSDQGSITGLLTVLVDGDDVNEPVADAARAILDGHIVLERRLAERGHFPAINVGASISRVVNEVMTPAQQAGAEPSAKSSVLTTKWRI